MAQFPYASLVETTKQLLQDAGFDVTLKSPTTGSGDRWNRLPGTPAEQTVRAAWSEFSYAELAGGLVQKTDRKMIMAPTDSTGAAVTPTTDASVGVGGSSDMKVHMVRRFGGNATTVAWEIVVRG